MKGGRGGERWGGGGVPDGGGARHPHSCDAGKGLARGALCALNDAQLGQRYATRPTAASPSHRPDGALRRGLRRGALAPSGSPVRDPSVESSASDSSVESYASASPVESDAGEAFRAASARARARAHTHTHTCAGPGRPSQIREQTL